MSKIQHFGIKFPFLEDDFHNFFLDTNTSPKEKVRSQIMHIVFTPKGQRLRCPDFGTDLIKYIFEQNDGFNWEEIKEEIRNSVNRWAPNIVLNNISVAKNEDDPSEIYVRLDYGVKEGSYITNDSIAVKL